MGAGEVPESSLITELAGLALALFLLDRQSDGRLSKWLGRKLRGIVSYLAMMLDAAHSGRETIAEAEQIQGAR